jgi:tRNA G18 (ribose-2'-O)-methylase SpoU
MGNRTNPLRRGVITGKAEGDLVLVAHNIRSAHNIGSLLRSADGAGVAEVWLSGYSARPAEPGRLFLTPAERAIEKTALGAEYSIPWRAETKFCRIAARLRKRGYRLVALEQSPRAVTLAGYAPVGKIALIVGNEVRGLERRVLHRCDDVLEIPMYGEKESLNVSVAGGIALFVLRGTMEARKTKNYEEGMDRA